LITITDVNVSSQERQEDKIVESQRFFIPLTTFKLKLETPVCSPQKLNLSEVCRQTPVLMSGSRNAASRPPARPSATLRQQVIKADAEAPLLVPPVLVSYLKDLSADGFKSTMFCENVGFLNH